MKRRLFAWLSSSVLALAASGSVLMGSAFAQVADFQIVWINVGEVAASLDGRTTRAGRQLFMAPDLVQFSLNKTTVARIEVDPPIIPLTLGERFCLTSLQVHANDEDRVAVDNAPMSVSVRQDQRERLAMERSKTNICVRPNSPGEYPVRFNSLLPARDGTTRGAQIFLRVHTDAVDAPSATLESTHLQSVI
jgi:hypothetical protein